MLGVFSTRSFGEFPKEEKGSHLSQILEDSPHPKYFLSAKACLGILNRADRKGKILPPKLREALERQSGLFAFRVTPLTAPIPPDATEGDGLRECPTHLIPWIVRPSPSAIPIDMRNATRNSASGEECGVGIGEAGDPAFTVTTDYAHAVAYGICALSSNSMNSNNPHSGIYEAATARTLDLNGGNPSCNQGGIFILEHHPQDSRIKLTEDDVVQTLSAKMGMGGGNVPLLMTAPPDVAAFMGGQGADAGSIAYNEKISPTIRSDAGGNSIPMVMTAPPSVIAVSGDATPKTSEGIGYTLMARDYKEPQIVFYQKEELKFE